MDELKIKIRELLSELAKEKNPDQAYVAIAKELNITKQAVHNILKGPQRLPTLEKLLWLAKDGLDCKIEVKINSKTYKLEDF